MMCHLSFLNRAGGCLTLALTTSMVQAATPLGTAWTYQGELKQNGSPVNDTCDCQFSLWDDPAAGTQVGPTLAFDGQGGNPSPISIVNGLFTIELDFGSGAFDGDARWLQIEVACPSGNMLSALDPRQSLTATPYALQTRGIHVDASGNVGIGTTSPTDPLHVEGDVRASGTISSGNTVVIDGTAHALSSDAGLDLHISTGRVLRLEPTATAPNVIGGYSGNSVTSPFPGATISGGGDAGFENQVAFSFGTVGGGAGNLAEGHSSTVAGGRFNIAGADQSTVGGGQSNTARRNGTVAGGSNNTAFNLVLGGATVAGGLNNAATGGGSAIGGGDTNAADGHYATVPGGHSNQAGGQFSIAAGRRAKVRTAAQVGGGDLDGDEGTLVWADSTNADFVSTGPNQFLIRASGGVGLHRNNPSHPLHVGTNTSNGNGAHVTAGGTWTNGSSRSWKSNLREVDAREILQRVADLPILRWQYTGSDEGDHIGPMAEEFAAAFGLGHSEKYISTVDADGVALAAIQGLHDIVRQKDAEIADLTARLERIEKLLALDTRPPLSGSERRTSRHVSWVAEHTRSTEDLK